MDKNYDNCDEFKSYIIQLFGTDRSCCFSVKYKNGKRIEWQKTANNLQLSCRLGICYINLFVINSIRNKLFCALIRWTKVLLIVSVRDYDGDSHQHSTGLDQSRELTRSIRREVNKLSDKWNELLQQTEHRHKRLDDVQRVSTCLDVLCSHIRHHINTTIGLHLL